MLLGQGCATGRDRPEYVRVGEADHVGVALADDRFAFFDDAGAVGVQPVQQLALVVDRCFTRCVLVLGAFLTWENPPSETAGISPLIGDREHDARPERILFFA